MHAAEVGTSGASAVSHAAFRNIDRRAFIGLAIPGICGGIAGALLLAALPGEKLKPFVAGYLVLHRDRPVDRRHLAFLLWPESTEPQALTNLRQLIHDVRGAFPDADRFIEAGRQLVRWVDDAPFVIDEVEHLLPAGDIEGHSASSLVRLPARSTR